MATAAAVAGDRIVGVCPGHLVPSALGPVPAGPLPFSAPVVSGVVTTVLVGGRPVVVAGCSGVSSPSHPALADAFTAASSQVGRVVSGSPTVFAGGRPLARRGSAATCCTSPGVLMASAETVVVA